MVRIPKYRRVRQILIRDTGKTVTLELASGRRTEVTIIAVGADCIQIDKIGGNFIPIHAIVMITRSHVKKPKNPLLNIYKFTKPYTALIIRNYLLYWI